MKLLELPVTVAAPALPRPVRTRAPAGATVSSRLLHAAILGVVYLIPALFAIATTAVGDPDVFWHLRTAEWIHTHHAIPHADPFSSTAVGKPWAAYSWLFELVVYGLFHHLGLPGILLYTAGMVLLIAAAIHHLLSRLCPDGSVAMMLTFVASFSMVHLFTPRPWLCTILLFVLELDILFHARRTARLRGLLLLPPLFALWSNVHIQFIDGLLLLGIFVAEASFNRLLRGSRTPVLPLALALAASLVATCANPYGWHIYQAAYQLAAQPGVLDRISELKAIPFRNLPDFLVLFLALAAAGAIARTRPILSLETALLCFAALLSFRSQRDIWITSTIASAVLAGCFAPYQRIPGRRLALQRSASTAPRLTTITALLLAGILLAPAFRIAQVTEARMESIVARDLPVDAVHFVLGKGYTGPVYNTYGWGGYLIWALRQPVNIDGRAALHGTERLARVDATWAAGPDWKNDPELRAARLVIGPAKSGLVQVLAYEPGFHLVYQDRLAAVFLHTPQPTTLTGK